MGLGKEAKMIIRMMWRRNAAKFLEKKIEELRMRHYANKEQEAHAAWMERNRSR